MKDGADGQTRGPGREGPRGPVPETEIGKSPGLKSERRLGLGPGLVPEKGDQGRDRVPGIREAHTLGRVPGRREDPADTETKEDQRLTPDPKKGGNQQLTQEPARDRGTRADRSPERGAVNQSTKPQRTKADGTLHRRKYYMQSMIKRKRKFPPPIKSRPRGTSQCRS